MPSRRRTASSLTRHSVKSSYASRPRHQNGFGQLFSLMVCTINWLPNLLYIECGLKVTKRNELVSEITMTLRMCYSTRGVRGKHMEEVSLEAVPEDSQGMPWHDDCGTVFHGPQELSGNWKSLVAECWKAAVATTSEWWQKSVKPRGREMRPGLNDSCVCDASADEAARVACMVIYIWCNKTVV